MAANDTSGVLEERRFRDGKVDTGEAAADEDSFPWIDAIKSLEKSE